MTATTRTLGTRRGTAMHIGRLTHGARAFLSAVRARWNDFVDAGQLGPSTEMVTSRHSGARI